MAIAVDATSKRSDNTWTTSGTQSHTVGTANNMILMVGIMINTSGGGDPLSSVTFAGTAMTQINKVTSRPNEDTYLYYILDPPSGTNDVVANVSGTGSRIYMANCSYSGVAQSGQPDGNDTSAKAPGSGTSLSSEVVTTADNCWGILYARNEGDDVLEVSGGTERTSGGFNTHDLLDTDGPKTPAGTVTITTGQSTTDSIVHCMATIAPFTENYKFYASVTVDNTKVSGSGNLSNFPVLISGTYDGTGSEPDIRTTANSGNVESTDSTGGASGALEVPADLVFSPNTDGSSPYDFEIESYSPSTGAIVAWVEIPTLDFDDDTVFYMVYGNQGVTTSQEDIGGVWGSYSAVWHMGEASGTRFDSTSNNLHLTDNNTVGTAAGQVGVGGDFERGGTEYLSSTEQALLKPTTNFTIQQWTKRESGGGDSQHTYHSHSQDSNVAGFYFQLGAGDDKFRLVSGKNSGVVEATDWEDIKSTTTMGNGTWYYSAGKWNGGSLIMFVDGASEGTASWSNAPSYAASTYIFLGAFTTTGAPASTMDGVVDEVRLAPAALTDDWLITDYNTQNSPSTFYTMGNETSPGGAAQRPGLNLTSKYW